VPAPNESRSPQVSHPDVHCVGKLSGLRSAGLEQHPVRAVDRPDGRHTFSVGGGGSRLCDTQPVGVQVPEVGNLADLGQPSASGSTRTTAGVSISAT
jgi:hypothetical protein